MASGGYATGLYLEWESWEVWKLLETIELVSDIQNKDDDKK